MAGLSLLRYDALGWGFRGRFKCSSICVGGLNVQVFVWEV